MVAVPLLKLKALLSFFTVQRNYFPKELRKGKETRSWQSCLFIDKIYLRYQPWAHKYIIPGFRWELSQWRKKHNFLY